MELTGYIIYTGGNYPMQQLLREIKHLALCTSNSEMNHDGSLSRWEFEKYAFLITGNFETVTVVHCRHPNSNYSDLVIIEIQDIDLSL